MKKKTENQIKIDDAKAIAKEKVAYGLAMTLFTVGAVAWGASIGFGIAGVLKVYQMILSMIASTLPTGLAFAIGTAGTRIDEEKPNGKLPKITKKNIKELAKEEDYNELHFEK